MRQEEETIRKTLWELNHLRNNKTKNWSLIYTESPQLLIKSSMKTKQDQS